MSAATKVRDVEDVVVRVVEADASGVWVHVLGDGLRWIPWAALRHGTTCPIAAVAARYARLVAEAEAMVREPAS